MRTPSCSCRSPPQLTSPGWWLALQAPWLRYALGTRCRAAQGPSRWLQSGREAPAEVASSAAINGQVGAELNKPDLVNVLMPPLVQRSEMQVDSRPRPHAADTQSGKKPFRRDFQLKWSTETTV